MEKTTVKDEIIKICNELAEADNNVQMALGNRARLHEELIYQFVKEDATHLLQLNRSAIRREARRHLR